MTLDPAIIPLLAAFGVLAATLLGLGLMELGRHVVEAVRLATRAQRLDRVRTTLRVLQEMGVRAR
jgi:hypothetical protein